MTTFEDVKVGDRVRLTHENGDLAEFTVNCVDGDELYSQVNTYDEEDGWQVEILEQPLPTKHGAMIGHPTDTEWAPFVYRAATSAWYLVGHSSRQPEDYVRHYMRSFGLVVLFEGIDAEEAGDD